jgi:hypothetical protein
MSFYKLDDTSLGGSSENKPVELYSAEVLSVDESSRTCNLKIRGQNGFTLKKVPYNLPALNPDGSGLDFVPVEGSMCIVAKQLTNMSSEFDSNPFILGFRPSSSKDTWAGDRMELASHDIALSSLERNRLELLSSGVTKLMSNEACSLEMYPDSNKILTYCSSYVLQTGGGYVEWLTDAEEEVGSSQFKAVIKTTADPEVLGGELVVIEAGDSETPKLKLTVKDPDSSTSGLLWEADSNGDMILEVKNTIQVKSGAATNVECLGGISMTSPLFNLNVKTTNITLTPEELVINAPKVLIKTESFIVEDSSGEQTFVRGEVEEEDDTLNKQLVTEEILDWVFNHVHTGHGVHALGKPMDTSEVSTEEITSSNISAAIAEAQQEAAATNSGILGELNLLKDLVTPISQAGVDASAPILLTLIVSLINKYTAEKTAAVAAASGSNAQSPGVINSYSQVLTQDTKVR